MPGAHAALPPLLTNPSLPTPAPAALAAASRSTCTWNDICMCTWHTRVLTTEAAVTTGARHTPTLGASSGGGCAAAAAAAGPAATRSATAAARVAAMRSGEFSAARSAAARKRGRQQAGSRTSLFGRYVQGLRRRAVRTVQGTCEC